MRLSIADLQRSRGLPLPRSTDCYLYSALLRSDGQSVFSCKRKLLLRWMMAITISCMLWYFSTVRLDWWGIEWPLKGMAAMVILLMSVVTLLLKRCLGHGTILKLTNEAVILQGSVVIDRARMILWVIVESPYYMTCTKSDKRAESWQMSLCAVVREEGGNGHYLWRETGHLDFRSKEVLIGLFQENNMPVATFNLDDDEDLRRWREFLSGFKNGAHGADFLALAGIDSWAQVKKPAPRRAIDEPW